MKAKYKQRGILSPVIDGSVPINQNTDFPVAYETWYEDEQGNKGPKGYFLAGGKSRPQAFYVFGHNMVGMQNQSLDKAAEAIYRRDEMLHDFDWFHCESWQDIRDYLPKQVKANEQAKHKWGGGVRYGGEPGQATEILEQMRNSSEAFMYMGGYVLFTYMQPTNNVEALVNEVEAFKEKYRVKVWIFKNGFLPYVMPGLDEVQGLQTDGQKYPQFSGITSPQSAEMVTWSLNNYPWTVEVPFPSENTTGEGLLNVNKALIEGSIAVGKPACVGDLSEYASDTGISRLTWEQRKANYEYLLSLPLDQRAVFMNENTDNDSVENTDQARTPNRGPIPGYGCFVPFNAGYVAGSNIRHPMAEHDGCSIAMNPYKLALKSGLSKPVVNDYRIFYNFIAHPKDTQPLTEVPELLAKGDKAYAEVFKESMYTKTYDEQIPAVQQAIRNYTPFIDVLVWSPKDCQIEVNGVRSEVLKAGVCTFRYELAEDYFGTPIIAIIVNGRSVCKMSTKQVRKASCFPDMYRTSYGYSELGVKGTIQALPVWKKTAKGLELTGSGKLMVRKGGGIAEPYDGPYKGSYPEQYFYGFKAATASLPDGPVALSFAI